VAILIIFAGLSGVGKTTIARELARQIGAVYLRIDSIEQALRDSAAVAQPLNEAGYLIAYALAEDNLRLGRTVVADSVNPLLVTRESWVGVAKRASVDAIEIEVQCSDRDEHHRRVEARASDIPGLQPPTWEEVVLREYNAWNREHVVIDTAACTVGNSVRMIREVLQNR
jgi:predicted kinase